MKVGLVYNSDRISLWMYKLLGWGIPLFIMAIWSTLMSVESNEYVSKNFLHQSVTIFVLHNYTNCVVELYKVLPIWASEFSKLKLYNINFLKLLFSKMWDWKKLYVFPISNVHLCAKDLKGEKYPASEETHLVMTRHLVMTGND